MDMSTSGPGRAGVLAVCTGNICRSPAVELLLRDRLGAHVDVASAGVGAVVGRLMRRHSAKFRQEFEHRGLRSPQSRFFMQTPNKSHLLRGSLKEL